jgi:hypothetical protein
MRRTLRRSLLHMQLITPFKLEPCEAQQDWPPPQGSRKATVPPALHFITALCLTSNWKLDCSICKNPTLWSYIFATHLAEKLSPSSATSWQTALQQETHAQARTAGASHLLLPRPFYRYYPHWIQQHILRAWIYAGKHDPVTTATATASQSCSQYSYYFTLHNLLLRIMETKYFISSRPSLSRRFTIPRELSTNFFLLPSKLIQCKTHADKVNHSVGRLLTQMKRKMETRLHMSRDLRYFRPGAISIKFRLGP